MIERAIERGNAPSQDVSYVQHDWTECRRELLLADPLNRLTAGLEHLGSVLEGRAA